MELKKRKEKKEKSFSLKREKKRKERKKVPDRKGLAEKERKRGLGQKSLEIVLTSDRDRSTSPVGSLGITRTFRVLAEPSNRGKKNVTPQVETERGGGRGVEFGWNSRDGGRGPFVVMATAGFHPLIDPPRSRSSTKPQTLSLSLFL